jgi:sarcosine oxidase subunit beta
LGLTPVENLFINSGWGTGGFKATPGSGWAFADTIAHNKAHDLVKPYSLDRFVTGHLIDEHGAAGVAH